MINSLNVFSKIRNILYPLSTLVYICHNTYVCMSIYVCLGICGYLIWICIWFLEQPRKFHQEACYPHLQLYIPTWNRKLLTHLGEFEQNHLDLQYTLITHSQYICHHAYPHHTSAQMVLLSIYSGQFRKPPSAPLSVGSQGTHVTNIHIQGLHIRALKAGLDLQE